MYKLIRNILFWFDAEQVHYFSMNFLRLLCETGFIRNMISREFTPHNIPVTAFGLQFKNPIGLGAGFDKNAKYLSELEMLGFGFIEIGTVTPLPQDGNDKPRLFRLPKDKALINRMGFNNDGVEEVAKRLKEWKEKKGQCLPAGQAGSMVNGQPVTPNPQPVTHNPQPVTHNPQPVTHNPQPVTHNPQLIIGGNIGKNKLTPNEDAWKDYEICFLKLYDWVDYFVVNVSSPNTPGLRELQQKDSLRKILSRLMALRVNQKISKPILLKISPDLADEEINDIIDLATEIKLDGLIVANTTIRREKLQTAPHELQAIGAGGLSGKPLKESSTQMVKYISERLNNQIPIIASGGIFVGEDAKEKINAGATLVQVWTGFIYEGPAIVKNICRALS